MTLRLGVGLHRVPGCFCSMEAADGPDPNRCQQLPPVLFLPAGTILGNNLMTGVLVQYDLQNRRIGFGAANCTALAAPTSAS